MRGICFVVLAGALIGTAELSHADAKLGVSQTEFSFGNVPQNARISHRYTLKSVGTDTLKIDRIQPGCGCTQAPLPKTELAPGDSTDGELIFNTGSYSGSVTKVAMVKTNPASVPETQLKFTANIVTQPDSTTPVTIKPFVADLSGTVANEARVTIKNVTAHDLTAKLVGWPSNLINVTLPKAVKAGQSVEVGVALTKEALAKSFESSVTVQFDDSAATRFTIPVRHLLPNNGATATPVSVGGH